MRVSIGKRDRAKQSRQGCRACRKRGSIRAVSESPKTNKSLTRFVLAG